MSSKRSLLLTIDSEHWYNECNAQFHEETKTEDCLVLQFDNRHRLDQYEDSFEVIIESDTPLYEEIMHTELGAKSLNAGLMDALQNLIQQIESCDGTAQIDTDQAKVILQKARKHSEYIPT